MPFDPVSLAITIAASAAGSKQQRDAQKRRERDQEAANRRNRQNRFAAFLQPGLQRISGQGELPLIRSSSGGGNQIPQLLGLGAQLPLGQIASGVGNLVSSSSNILGTLANPKSSVQTILSQLNRNTSPGFFSSVGSLAGKGLQGAGSLVSGAGQGVASLISQILGGLP